MTKKSLGGNINNTNTPGQWYTKEAKSSVSQGTKFECLKDLHELKEMAGDIDDWKNFSSLMYSGAKEDAWFSN